MHSFAQTNLLEMFNCVCCFILYPFQCEKKEEYIERIQALDFDTKAAIAVHIQEVFDIKTMLINL